MTLTGKIVYVPLKTLWNEFVKDACMYPLQHCPNVIQFRWHVSRL